MKENLSLSPRDFSYPLPSLAGGCGRELLVLCAYFNWSNPKSREKGKAQSQHGPQWDPATLPCPPGVSGVDGMD